MKITIARVIVAAIAGGVLAASIPVAIFAAAMCFGMTHFQSMDAGARWSRTDLLVNWGLIAALGLAAASCALFPAAIAVLFLKAFAASAAGFIVVGVFTKVLSSSNPFSGL